jgi:argininosuccinate lyase
MSSLPARLCRSESDAPQNIRADKPDKYLFPVRFLLISNLPSGYNRELQLLKQLIFNAFYDLKECIEILILMLKNIVIRRDITDNPAYNSIFSTEEVNRLVRSGVPFRDAYKKVGEIVKRGSFSKTVLSDYSHEGSIGNLCNEEIAGLFNERMKSFHSKSADELAEKMIANTKS